MYYVDTLEFDAPQQSGVIDDGTPEVPTVFEMLDDEWQGLAADRDAAQRLPEVCALAGDATSLADVVRFVRRAAPPDADAILLALVSRAVDGDQFAARVLLQLLLPGARNLARRWWAIGDRRDRAAAAVTAVYQRISAYPLERRPGRVAANILMDAARELRRSVPRVITTPSADPCVKDDPAAWRDHNPTNPAAELAEVLLDAVHEGVLNSYDAELIARSRIAGERVTDIAAHRNVGSRTLWHRRQRAERTLVAAYSGVH